MMFAEMTAADVYSLVVRRHDLLTGLVVACLALNVIVPLIHMAYKRWWFNQMASKLDDSIERGDAMIQLVGVHAKITDTAATHAKQASAKADAAASVDHDKVEEIHKTVKRIDEKLPDSPSGVSSPGGP
jgi:hypothetical protein